MVRALAVAALLVVALPACRAYAADQPSGGADIKREIIPGSQLMTSAERERYRQRMREAASPDEQARIREDHVKRMQERARLRGLRLADPGAGRSAR